MDGSDPLLISVPFLQVCYVRTRPEHRNKQQPLRSSIAERQDAASCWLQISSCFANGTILVRGLPDPPEITTPSQVSESLVKYESIRHGLCQTWK